MPCDVLYYCTIILSIVLYLYVACYFPFPHQYPDGPWTSLDPCVASIAYVPTMPQTVVGPFDYLSAGFKAGVPIRYLFDTVIDKFGNSGWCTEEAQKNVVACCFGQQLFVYGHVRERRFLRLLLDEIDRTTGGVVAEELTMAAVERCNAPCGPSPISELELLGSSLFVSSAMSDVALRLWDAGVALTDALYARGNYLRDACSEKRVVEIGSGTGLTGRALQDAGATFSILTDRPDPSVMANLRSNIVRNCDSRLVEGRPLDVASVKDVHDACSLWGAEVVVGADLCYCPELTVQMVRAFTEFVNLSGARAFLVTTVRQKSTQSILHRELSNSSLPVTVTDVSERVLGINSGTGYFPFVFWNYGAIEVLELNPSCDDVPVISKTNI